MTLSKPPQTWVFHLLGATLLLSLCSCTVKTSSRKTRAYAMEVSIPDQKMGVYHQGKMVKEYSVSTSKFGEGAKNGSYKTPLGKFEVAEKIGGDKPLGAVFKSRRWTGEVLKPNAPGRDPIVSRILWLHGLERKNKNTYSRCIYIHGTAAESDIGKRASYGCVRMKSSDIIELYQRVGHGSSVHIVDRKLWAGTEHELEAAPSASARALASTEQPEWYVEPIFVDDTPAVWEQASIDPVTSLEPEQNPSF